MFSVVLAVKGIAVSPQIRVNVMIQSWSQQIRSGKGGHDPMEIHFSTKTTPSSFDKFLLNSLAKNISFQASICEGQQIELVA